MAVDTLIEAIKKLSVTELAELVKALEEEFGVSAAAPVAMMAGPAAGGGEAAVVEEQSEFDVILTVVGDKKIQVIKEVRAVTGLGLKEAKEVVDGAPKPIKEKVAREEADDIKAKLEAVGATIEIK
ncbi:MAG: 50S ribosomal protein L7/L12 [Thermoleophilia bacterium]